MSDSESEDIPAHHDSRLRLILEVLVFQMKLAADGLRDVLLVPVSIGAAIAGLLTGGEQPDVYFRRVLRFGRRTEHWINLFGPRHHRNTADEWVRPFEESVIERMRHSGRARKGVRHVNQLLDSVNERPPQKPSDPPNDGGSGINSER